MTVVLCSWSGRQAGPTTCHHDTKVKPEAATAVIELLMMGGKTPETCCAVNKRQDNKLENCCIWLVIYLNCTIKMLTNLTNLKLRDLLWTNGPSIRRREPQTSLPLATARRALNSAPVLTGEVLQFSNKPALITLRNVTVRILGNLVKGCSDHRLLQSGGKAVGNKEKFCGKKHVRCILIFPNASRKNGMLVTIRYRTLLYLPVCYT